MPLWVGQRGLETGGSFPVSEEGRCLWHVLLAVPHILKDSISVNGNTDSVEWSETVTSHRNLSVQILLVTITAQQ